MKRLLTAAACAALLVSPAFAQTVTEGTQPPEPAVECPAIPDAPPDHPCPPSQGGNAGPLSLSAAPTQATGTITSIDVAAGTVTLDDGKSFAMQNSVALNSVSVGQRVTISYMSHDGRLLASDVKPATSEEPPEPPAALENRY
jgi:hypothetical protein